MSDGNLAAALDEIRERYKTSFITLPAEGWTHISSADDIPRLMAALDEVLKLHVPAVIQDARPPFRYCSRCSGHPGWPCPEVAAISRALLGEDGR